MNVTQINRPRLNHNNLVAWFGQSFYFSWMKKSILVSFGGAGFTVATPQIVPSVWDLNSMLFVQILY